VPTVAVQTTPKVRKPHIQVLADDELTTLFQYIEERPLYMPVLFAASTGMRRGEILGLRWCDLDFDRSTLQIAQIVEALKKSVSIKEPKTERSRRTIVLPATIVQELKAHRKAQAEHLPQTRVQSVRAGVPDLGWETHLPLTSQPGSNLAVGAHRTDRASASVDLPSSFAKVRGAGARPAPR